MTDPLSLLRQYNIDKKETIERDNQIIFGELSWPKNVKTNFRITAGPKSKKADVKEYYTLECLLYLIKHSDLVHPEYCKKADDDKIQAVRRPDRKYVLSYLNGTTDTCIHIDKSAPMVKPTRVKVKRELDDEDEVVVSKKPHIEETRIKKEEESHVKNEEETCEKKEEETRVKKEEEIRVKKEEETRVKKEEE